MASSPYPYAIPFDLTNETAWTDVHSAKEEVRKMHDNEFRAEHPHLAEWKEVRTNQW
jgi:hypothetical protein